MHSHVKIQPSALKHLKEARSSQDQKFWMVGFFTFNSKNQFSPGNFSSLHLEIKSLGQGELFIT